jgi:hypothetical protein
MKAHYLTCKEKAAAKAVAKAANEKSGMRLQTLWVLSMYNIGLSPKTINRAANEMTNVCEKYHGYLVNGVGDEALERDMKAIGLEALL